MKWSKEHEFYGLAWTEKKKRKSFLWIHFQRRGKKKNAKMIAKERQIESQFQKKKKQERREVCSFLPLPFLLGFLFCLFSLLYRKRNTSMLVRLTLRRTICIYIYIYILYRRKKKRKLEQRTSHSKSAKYCKGDSKAHKQVNNN